MSATTMLAKFRRQRHHITVNAPFGRGDLDALPPCLVHSSADRRAPVELDSSSGKSRRGTIHARPAARCRGFECSWVTRTRQNALTTPQGVLRGC